MTVCVTDAATGMSVTYWNVPEERVTEVREKAKRELDYRKDQLSGIPIVRGK